jgi:hypothetical protein
MTLKCILAERVRSAGFAGTAWVAKSFFWWEAGASMNSTEVWQSVPVTAVTEC